VLPQGGGGFSSLADKSLIQLLVVLIAVLAGLGVLNSVLMVTRERVHDLGIFKALGMTPRQTIIMVGCWSSPRPSPPPPSPCQQG
jgi:putative ABC transport system permease protein